MFTLDGEFLPLSSLDTNAIEQVFRGLVLVGLHRAERLSETFMERLMSWHPSGFSVCARQLVMPDETERLLRLARYMTRAPVRLKSIDKLDDDRVRVTTPPDPRTGQCNRTLDVLDWIHAVTTQIPDPKQHGVRYLGAYACRNHIAPRPQPAPHSDTAEQQSDDTPFVKARRASWARLIRKIFEVDPLLCRCGAQLEIVSVITEPDVVDRILSHLHSERSTARNPFEPSAPRAPPG